MQKKKYDVTALGELLIDFSHYGTSNKGENLYEQNPGGAPCNVLAMLTKCGKKTAFIGKVGADMFGDMLKDTLDKVGIDRLGLTTSENVNTTLAFVQIEKNGERRFSFYRNPGADTTLMPEEVSEDIIKNSRVFHFGTLSMTHDDSRNATKKAIEIAKQYGCLLSFDPNVRMALWHSEKALLEGMNYGCSKCDILKISEDELTFMAGISDMDEAVSYLKEHYPVSLILVTLGAGGSYAYYKNHKVFKHAFLTDKTIDTTGAGDTFLGGCLIYILEKGISDLDENDLDEMLSFANKAASIVTTKKGALKVMPQRAEITW